MDPLVPPPESYVALLDLNLSKSTTMSLKGYIHRKTRKFYLKRSTPPKERPGWMGDGSARLVPRYPNRPKGSELSRLLYFVTLDL